MRSREHQVLIWAWLLYVPECVRLCVCMCVNFTCMSNQSFCRTTSRPRLRHV